MEDKDIRRDPKVRQTLQDMGLAIDQIWAMGNGDLAFFMRDASDREAWEFYLVEEWYRDKYRSFASNSRHAFQHSTPEQWIDAAVKVWEAKK